MFIVRPFFTLYLPLAHCALPGQSQIAILHNSAPHTHPHSLIHFDECTMANGGNQIKGKQINRRAPTEVNYFRVSFRSFILNLFFSFSVSAKTVRSGAAMIVCVCVCAWLVCDLCVCVSYVSVCVCTCIRPLPERSLVFSIQCVLGHECVVWQKSANPVWIVRTCERKSFVLGRLTISHSYSLLH